MYLDISDSYSNQFLIYRSAQNRFTRFHIVLKRKKKLIITQSIDRFRDFFLSRAGNASCQLYRQASTQVKFSEINRTRVTQIVVYMKNLTVKSILFLGKYTFYCSNVFLKEKFSQKTDSSCCTKTYFNVN